VTDLPLSEAAELAGYPEPWPTFGRFLRAQENLNEASKRAWDDIVSEQKRLYEEQGELRDEVFALSVALAAAGIKIPGPPTLRGVS
jgi:hypothetical protein